MMWHIPLLIHNCQLEGATYLVLWNHFKRTRPPKSSFVFERLRGDGDPLRLPRTEGVAARMSGQGSRRITGAGIG